jgi:gamma-glutamylcyclotransferase (GGCT)/AIG2-like uncharacterized protein YtfP
MKTRVFVYGTLKRGYGLHSVLHGQRFLGHAQTAPRYRLYDVGCFPALVEHVDGLPVQGEVYEVDARTLAALDRCEGEGHLYRRAQIQLDGDAATAVAYFWLGSTTGMDDLGHVWPATQEAR